MKHLVEPIRKKEDVARIERYLAGKSLRNRLIFVFGVNTGLRVSDILGLNVADVAGKTHVEICEKKTGKFKKFPLNNKLKGLLDEFVKDKSPEDALFVGKKHKRLDRSQVYRFLNKACNNLGITANVGTHTMRKTFGYHHYKQFKDVVLLQKNF